MTSDGVVVLFKARRLLASEVQRSHWIIHIARRHHPDCEMDPCPSGRAVNQTAGERSETPWPCHSPLSLGDGSRMVFLAIAARRVSNVHSAIHQMHPSRPGPTTKEGKRGCRQSLATDFSVELLQWRPVNSV